MDQQFIINGKVNRKVASTELQANLASNRTSASPMLPEKQRPSSFHGRVQRKKLLFRAMYKKKV